MNQMKEINNMLDGDVRLRPRQTLGGPRIFKVNSLEFEMHLRKQYRNIFSKILIPLFVFIWIIRTETYAIQMECIKEFLFLISNSNTEINVIKFIITLNSTDSICLAIWACQLLLIPILKGYSMMTMITCIQWVWILNITRIIIRIYSFHQPFFTKQVPSSLNLAFTFQIISEDVAFFDPASKIFSKTIVTFHRRNLWLSERHHSLKKLHLK